MVKLNDFIAALESVRMKYGGDISVAVNNKPDEILFDIGVSSVFTGGSDMFEGDGVCIITLGTTKNNIFKRC